MQTERPPARSSPARGVALIATAVIIGLFVLRNGFEDGSADTAEVASEAPAEDAGAGADAGDAGEDAAPEQAEEAPPAEEGGGGGDGGGDGQPQEPPPPRPPEEVTVLVANASGATGAAGTLTDNLAGGGYQTVEATNAPEPSETTVVHFAEGFKREATTVAQSINAPAGGVAPMPAPPPVELQGAQVLILLGLDLTG